MKKVIVVCDGACSGNGKEEAIGGWGAVLVYGEQVKEIFGGSPKTTNNIMELTAAIEALKCLKSKDLNVEIYSDSAYVVNCFRQGWYKKWLLNGWMTSKKEPVENQALWETLIDLTHAFASVSYFKIKGHLNASSASELSKWYKKFNTDNQLNHSLDDFKNLVELNHKADALANEGMAPYKR